MNATVFFHRFSPLLPDNICSCQLFLECFKWNSRLIALIISSAKTSHQKNHAKYIQKSLNRNLAIVHSKKHFQNEETQLRAYFAGNLQRFNISYETIGTAFEKKVWKILTEIPFGETRSYGDIARDLKSPGAGRAVGNACGKNPIPIIIPCHRVVRRDGSPGGFSSGVRIKKNLLKFENIL